MFSFTFKISNEHTQYQKKKKKKTQLQPKHNSISQLMQCWCLLHMRAVKSQTTLRIHIHKILSEQLLFANTFESEVG